MPNQQKGPLKFDCFQCGKTSVYEDYLVKNNTSQKQEAIVQKCKNPLCGKENRLEISDGWKKGGEKDNVYRGGIE